MVIGLGRKTPVVQLPSEVRMQPVNKKLFVLVYAINCSSSTACLQLQKGALVENAFDKNMKFINFPT